MAKKFSPWLVLLFLAFVLALAVAEETASAVESPVTQTKFAKMIEIMKRMYQRIDEIEARMASGSGKSANSGKNSDTQTELEALRQRVAAMEAELGKGGRSSPAKTKGDAVDLDQLDSSPTQSAVKEKAQPMFKVYFDLDFYSMPGGTTQGSGLTFDNFHSLILLDFVPTEDIHFSVDVNPSPKFYELDYQISRPVMMRFGKIWIPFDDMSPHNLFGGRTDVSRISQGDAFLPDLFTDLGVGVQIKLADSPELKLVADAYVVNGFQSGGTDPVTPNSLYPKFGPELSLGPDNNRDKAFGGRLHTLLGNALGIGGSYYTDRWTNNADPFRRLVMTGEDAQFYLGSTAFRAGAAQMTVQLPPTATQDSFKRGGTYAEISQKIGSEQHWKFLIRGGTLNLDDRIIDINDKQIGGVGLIFKPNLIEWSIEHSRDFKRLPIKGNYSFTNFRIIASF